MIRVNLLGRSLEDKQVLTVMRAGHRRLRRLTTMLAITLALAFVAGFTLNSFKQAPIKNRNAGVTQVKPKPRKAPVKKATQRKAPVRRKTPKSVSR